ncbi:CoxG family protein [Actinacidiphila rubida]|uniref:Carbon monoxide dehydrogenase subunit G n=1 Tax=Actinacidiphila rubida TaxID=310780 RepID=A0A1H8PNG8_9ACTN|nr:SRPBCC domain-containing protein [Actinacidiphila rubida]SEO43267.1 Carbon monoxide dehydrogenase subunit G [Actinacidiphila rubida]
MEHESFVPIPPARLTQALRSPAVLAASLPGWQPDRAEATDAPPNGARGRLRLRVAGSTVTYRGTVTLTGDASPFTLEAQGEEVRGTGTVKASAELILAATEQPEPGTALTFRGSAEADGRLTSYDDAVVESALRRLLDRFSAELAANAPEGDMPVAAEEAPEDRAEEPAPPGDAPDARDDDDVPDVVDDDGEPVPSSDLEEFELVEVEVEVPESAAALDDLVTPAEAAHARRTMIGRSAEEVDHAPPRGRYAPVPAPDSGTATATLRWAAPAAAALLASAVVVGRVLRRRR